VPPCVPYIALHLNAGWSSLVARQAHNLKAAGSNPAPATNLNAYVVYILRNSASRLYIGLTDDLERRLGQHNSGVSRWAGSRGPWTVIWHSQPLSLKEARKLENLLKRQKGGAGLYRITGLEQPGSSSSS
jgi:predicted GIY-YIG superfamily endonuclease